MNSKTEISLDFSRDITCTYKCAYCYVKGMVSRMSTYEPKVIRNAIMAKDTPTEFSSLLNKEYRQLENKLKLDNNFSVRIYGGGDYLPEHYEFLKLLDFKYYIISKALAQSSYIDELAKVVTLDNTTSVVLSFDKYTLANQGHANACKNMLDKIKIAYTGTPIDFKNLDGKEHVDIFFNILKTNQSKEDAKEFAASCPCATGAEELKSSCTRCKRCK